MTITRIWQAGGETGNSDEFDGIVNNFGVNASGAYTGSYGFRAYTSNGICYGVVNIPATRQIRFGFFVQVYDWGNESADEQILDVRTSSGHLFSLEYDQATDQMRLYVAGVNYGYAPIYEGTTWYHFGIDAKIDSTSGWVKFYVNGVEVASHEGNTGNADIEVFRIGQPTGYAGGAHYVYYDDLFIDDTTGEASADVVPVKRFYYLTPNANGNYSQWDGSDGNSVDNYQLVDEIPASDADFVQEITADQYDSYGMSTFTLAANQEIVALIPIVRAKRAGTTEEIAIGTRLSSTDSMGSEQTLSTVYDKYWERQETKPGGGAWGQSDMDSVELVIMSSGSF